MYKLIACDVDETLLTNKHEVTPLVKQKIHEAMEQGVVFALATGRGFMMVQDILKDLGLHNMKNEYVISFNGGSLTENFENREIIFKGLSFDLAERIFKLGLNYPDVGIHLYTDTDMYLYNYVADEQHLVDLGAKVMKEPSIDFAKEMTIAKIIFQNYDTDYLVEIHDEILPHLEGEVSMSYSSNRYLEINADGISKGETLLKLADKLGIKQEETLAIGDNSNDITMIEAAGLGVAVGNAVDALKEVADVIMDETNDESAVAHVIEKYVL